MKEHKRQRTDLTKVRRLGAKASLARAMPRLDFQANAPGKVCFKAVRLLAKEVEDGILVQPELTITR